MDLEKRNEAYEGGEGCLTTVIRIPVRIVVLLVVIPVRMVWDVLTACGRAIDRVLLRPLGRALEWVWDTLLVPVGRALAWLVSGLVTYGIVVPCQWLYRRVLTPLGRGIAWLVRTLVVTPLVWFCRTVLAPVGRGLGCILRAVFVWPFTALYRWVLTPVGHGLAWLGTVLVVVPCRWLYRWVLTPVGRGLLAVGREIVAAAEVAWRVAGYVSRAVGRALKWLAWQLVGRPAAWFYRTVCTPVGHAVRDHLWRPARRAAVAAGRAAKAALVSAGEVVRKARRDAWRALVGDAAARQPLERAHVPARTLGSTTTAPGAAPAPEISLRKRG
ncbi:hypothetical protein [Streptomyces sp. NRRL S-118]|uniref:hypothetical protein n=1 Tax=Streptomyces sp. NRRL S-118 TaxID=1463881 RepID=UPI000587AA45|nr:hypothetical protein [Streptomyces sp. NRRL S-118]